MMNKCTAIWGVLLLFVITGCGVPHGQLRIRGEYTNLDQADFLIYSMDGGLDRVDTLHIRQGEFEFLTDLRRTATYHILYPNNDELMVWASTGDDVRIEGDALNLSKVEVTGNEENELYTEFRQQFEPNDTVTARRCASAFIRQHPESPVSIYLLERHFLQSQRLLPVDTVQSLYQVISKAQPRNNEVALLGGRIHQRYALQKGQAMPDFSVLSTDSVTHTLRDYRGKRLLVYFWAGWVGSTQASHRSISETLDEVDDVEALSYSLDVDSVTFEATKGADYLGIPICCDYQGFQGALVKQLGITQIPMTVLVDRRGKIIMADPELGNVLKTLKTD